MTANLWGSHKPVLNHLLNTRDIKSVFEFGCGDNSTPLFANKCQRVVSVEMDHEHWFDKMNAQFHNYDNVFMELRNDSTTHAIDYMKELGERFDLVFVDGVSSTRWAAVNEAANWTHIIVAHDTEAACYEWERVDLDDSWTRTDYTNVVPWTTVWQKKCRNNVIPSSFSCTYSIKQQYDSYCSGLDPWGNIYSDIYEHLPTLYRYAKECKTVTEFGVNAVVSTYALAMARPEKLTAVDIIRHPNVDIFLSQCKMDGIDNVIFHESSTLEYDLEPVELLFIDTLHTYRQMKQELLKHSKSVLKYIIFHDTVSFGRKDEGNLLNKNDEKPTNSKEGVLTAIEEFLDAHNEWVIKENFVNNNGLMVIERVD